MILKYLVAAAIVLGASAPVSAQSVNAGIEAWRKSDYAGAVAIWRPLAVRGNADAAFNLGQAYRLGKGVPINLATAKGWLEKAAAQGHVDAQTTLGLLLFQNGDQAPALKWLKMAAEQGEPRAMLIYGTALFNGDTVSQNPPLGYAYVYRSDAQGLPAARDVLVQLDRLMSAADKKKALAMADAQDKAAARALFNPAKPAETASAKPAKPAETASAKPAKPPRTPKAATLKPVVKTAARPAVAAPAAAAPAVAASGAWRIQLGAFSQRGSAETLYRKLSGNAALAGRSPFYVAAGPITRLQVGPFPSRAAAATACAALKTACFPVAAK
jgi:cell division septation protein DedD